MKGEGGYSTEPSIYCSAKIYVHEKNLSKQINWGVKCGPEMQSKLPAAQI